MRPRSFVFTLALCMGSVCQAQSLPAYTIKSVIGTGTAGYAGDGAAASAAQLNFPMAIVRASNGTLYIADSLNNRIRSVQSDGIIRTVVGTGTRGFSADGTAATSALIGSVYGMAVDANNVLYFTDTVNNVVRKVATNGNVSAIAGSGAAGFSGDGAAATLAALNVPTGIAVDPAGNVYFSDSQNHRVRKIGTDGNISTFAGNGVGKYAGDGGPAINASLNVPDGLSLDAAGNLYIADSNNHAIRKVAKDGTITTVAGTGHSGYQGDFLVAAASMLSYPRGVFVTASGVILIADTGNNRVRAVTEDGLLRPIAGSGFFSDGPDNISATGSPLRFPRALIPDGAGGLYLLDTDNNRIRQLTAPPGVPAISSGGVLSLSGFGSFTKGARGSWLEIHGTNLAAGTREWTADDFVNGEAPTSLSGTSVTIGGVPAYLSYISPTQINVQVPDTVPTGDQAIVVSSAQGSSTAYPFTFLDTMPGLFAPYGYVAGGKQYAGVVLGDGTLADLSKPLHAGDTVTLYGIGFGNVAPLSRPGEVTRSASAVVRPLKVFFGNAEASVSYAGLTPGALALYQINVVVPGVEGDAVPLTFVLNGEAGQQTLYTSVGH